MKKLRPIKLNGNCVGAEIRLICNYSPDKPYLSLTTKIGGAYIEDRDVKRLKKWCELCLKK